MFSSEFMISLRDELAQKIQSHRPPPFCPLPISPWLAMSLLQKAIRRGHEEFALQAAATLLHDAPDRLGRRLAIIGFEDVGLGELETVGLSVAAMAGKNFRASIGGEWAVGSYLVQRLAQANKCRATDDLLTVADRHLAYDRARLHLTFQPMSHLLKIASGDASLPVRALAIWYGIGTDRYPTDNLRRRKGDPQAIFDALRGWNVPPATVAIAWEGFRRTGQILCPFLALLASEKQGEARLVADDRMPPETMCGPLPSWACDMFTRPGRRALRLFLDRDCPTAQWVRAHIPSSQRVVFLGDLLFAVESGLMKRRRQWPVAEDLQRLATVECQGPYCPDATEIMDLLRHDIPILNEVRGHVC